MITENLGLIPAGFWVNVEGTDCSGKSLLAEDLEAKLPKSYPDRSVLSLPEFSGSPVGLAIQAIIRERTFFSLGEEGRPNPIAETLVLAGDYMMQLESLPRDESGIVITDRGPMSFLVYQGIRLTERYGACGPGQKWIRDVMRSIRDPDLTLCLVSDMEIIEKRLRIRGDRVTPEGLDFIQRAQEMFIQESQAGGAGKKKILVNNGDFEEVSRRAVEVVRMELIKKG